MNELRDQSRVMQFSMLGYNYKNLSKKVVQEQVVGGNATILS